MRIAVLIVSLASASMLRICGSDESDTASSESTASSEETAQPTKAAPVAQPVQPVPAAEPVAQADPVAQAPQAGAQPAMAQYGGTVVPVTNHSVEVVPKTQGRVYAYVSEPSGGAPPPESIQLTVHVPGRDQQMRPVPMVWDPQLSVYQGHYAGARADQGPCEVVLVRHGETHRGRIEAMSWIAIGDGSAPVAGARRPGVAGRPAVLGHQRRTVAVPGGRVQDDRYRGPLGTKARRVQVRGPGGARGQAVRATGPRGTRVEGVDVRRGRARVTGVRARTPGGGRVQAVKVRDRRGRVRHQEVRVRVPGTGREIRVRDRR